MKLVLTIVGGDYSGQKVALEGYNSFILGRSSKAHAQLEIPPDPQMSRYHMLLETSTQGCRVVDLDSSNGVFVNGDRVEETPLEAGDLLRVGQTTMIVTFDGLLPPPEPDSDAADEAGEAVSLDEYEFVEEIAEGHLGSVWRARDRRTDEPVAVKLLRAPRKLDRLAIKHFLREARVTAALRHPNIVRTLASGETDGELWLAMELVEGPSLEEHTAMQGRLSPADARTVGLCLLDALTYAHARGVVHRDVKPANVLLAGGSLRAAKLADFSLAKSLREQGVTCLTLTGDAKGTPWFMPPEQFENAKAATVTADVYELGATLYNALSGSWHFGESGYGRNFLRAILLSPYVPIRDRCDVPERLASVVDQALARDPAERFQTAKAMHRALHEADCGDN